MKIHERVKRYLDDNGIKQVAVARATGMKNSTFNAILTGKRTMYAEDYEAICKALNVPADKFFTPTDRTA